MTFGRIFGRRAPAYPERTPERRPFTTDAGSSMLLAEMDGSGIRQLEMLLRSFDRVLAGQAGPSSGTIESNCFVGRNNIRTFKMELDAKAKENDKIVTTVEFASGIKWRRGSLRIPGAMLPTTAKVAIKGMRIGDIIEGAPFPDFVIKSAIQDSGPKGGNLRITCTGSEQIPIERS